MSQRQPSPSAEPHEDAPAPSLLPFPRDFSSPGQCNTRSMSPIPPLAPARQPATLAPMLDSLFDHAAITDGITVRVAVSFLPEQSAPAEQRWFWTYHIRIENHSDQAVQLLSRHWRITDAGGAVQLVEGDGVVGEQPVLRPGEAHDYVSGCPLATAWGSMEGRYTFAEEDGTRFDAAIPFFPLEAGETQAR